MNYVRPRSTNKLILGWIWVGMAFLLARGDDATAGEMELSAGFSYSRTNYADASFSWSRRASVGFGYYFWGESELTFEVEDVLFRTKITDVQDTTFHDQVYSIDWVQGLAPRSFPFHPYIKVGMGQLNRTSSGSYANGDVPPAVYDTLTAVLGAGFKFKFYRSIALKVEAKTYLMGGSIATAQDNFSVNSGLAFFF